LLAPRSGVETREMIREELDNQMRGAGDALKEKSDVIKEKADVLKSKMAEVASDLEEAGRRVLGRFSEKSETT
jgi:gas vesicle protein